MASEVAFDESGNTGDNLLDRSQPIYTLASIQLAEDDAEALIDEAVPSRDGELKYSSLRRSRVGREAIVRILGSDLMKPGRARVTAMHKPFSTVGVVGYPKESLRQLLCDARTLFRPP